MQITINGKRWQLVRSRLKNDDGQCDPPDWPNKAIRIDKRLKGLHKLDTEIHEMLHAGQWNLDEEFVEKLAGDIARALYRMGYRDSETESG